MLAPTKRASRPSGDANHDAKRAALDLRRPVKPRWPEFDRDLAPPKSLADYGHTEPERGAEWWGKSVLLTFALFVRTFDVNNPDYGA